MKDLRVVLVTNDNELQKVFLASDLFATVSVKNKLSISWTDETFVISDQLVEYHEFVQYLNEHPVGAGKVFYLTSISSGVSMKNMKLVLNSKHVDVVPYGFTRSQILQHVSEGLGLSVSHLPNVITFFGADGKVGTSMTVMSLAEEIAENSKAKVCLINLSGQPSFDFIDGITSANTIDTVKMPAINGILTADELYDTCYTKGNLSVLSSSRVLGDIPYFFPEHVESIIRLAADRFDMVLVDAGHNVLISGMYIGALNISANRFLITTQQESAKQYFDMVHDQVLSMFNINKVDFMLIINKYVPVSSLMDAESLVTTYKSVYAGQLKYVEYGWQAELQHKTLRSYDPEYAVQISQLAQMVTHLVGADYTMPIKTKPRWFSFSKAKGG